MVADKNGKYNHTRKSTKGGRGVIEHWGKKQTALKDKLIIITDDLKNKYKSTSQNMQN